jgi:protoporphyrinogen oxidase
LGAALALGDSAIVLESRETAGGLCGTVTLDGAIFDLGGHSFHTPHSAIRQLLFDALEMEEQIAGGFTLCKKCHHLSPNICNVCTSRRRFG